MERSVNMTEDDVKLNKAKVAAKDEPVLTSTEIIAVKQLVSILNTGALTNLNKGLLTNCDSQYSCCHDFPKPNPHCPAEMNTFSCLGDSEGNDFLKKIGDHQAVIGSYILANKESVLAYFKSQGVNLQL
jgi:hypothetical protein